MKSRRAHGHRIIAVLICLAIAIAAGFGVFFFMIGCENVAPDPPQIIPETPAPPKDEIDLSKYTLEQKVGQMIMVGLEIPTPTQDTYDAINLYHIGNIFLHGRSMQTPAEIAQTVATATGLANEQTTGGSPMLVAVDQEGGRVQALKGDGFSLIPDAYDQGRMPTDDLRLSAKTWGTELASAGVNQNMAPVGDTVSSGEEASYNPPIGLLDRAFGYDTAIVASHCSAVANGLNDSGVIPTIKHFPGLGHVTENTDTAQNVTDPVISANSEDIATFGQCIADGAVPVVMMSSAIYSFMDPNNPAVFSLPIIRDVLRGDLGFDGVIISDDLSMAAQVSAWTPAERAINAVNAGVDILLISNTAAPAAEMAQALVDRANTNPGFAKIIDESVTRIMKLKQKYLLNR